MIIDNALYRHGRRLETDCPTDDLAGIRELVSEDGDFVWVGLHDPSAEELARVAEVYHLHELAVEDAVSAHQRPKLERYDGMAFLVLKTLWYVDENDAVETGEIAIFVGRDFVVTVRHGEGASLHGARESLEGMEKLLAHGPTAVVYAVCDEVVDRYEEVASYVVEDVDEVETSVFSEQRTNDSNRIYVLKRELAEMRRAVYPLRDPIGRFASGNVPGAQQEATTYFRDIADHLARVSETIEELDNLLSTAFDAHMAQISIQQNDDMRKLSVLAGFVVVPTFIAGLYGMNFKVIPELTWTYGYPYALALMVTSIVVIWLVAKRGGWL